MLEQIKKNKNKKQLRKFNLSIFEICIENGQI